MLGIEATLGPYTLIRSLCSASQRAGQVYLARSPTHHGNVVLKLLPTNAGTDERKQFLHELEVLQQLNHSGFNFCLPVYACGEDKLLVKERQAITEPINSQQNLLYQHQLQQTTVSTQPCNIQQTYYLALPYVEQGSLKQRLNKGLLSPGQIKVWWLSLLDAVEALHRHGWLHLDLKPSNILIGQHGLNNRPVQIFLIDFALARPIDAGAPITRTITCGTPRYMSPEQFLGLPLDQQSDFYSLGLILYEMLMGNSVFYAGTYQDWAIQHCQQPVPELPADLAGFQELIDGLLAKNNTRRLSSMNEIRQLTRQAF